MQGVLRGPEVPAKWSPCAQHRSFTPLLPVIAQLLTERSARSDGPVELPAPNSRYGGYRVTAFDSSVMPSMSIEDYLVHLATHSRCSPSTWVVMWMLICRTDDIGGLPFTPLRAHRMVLAAVLVASKASDDFGRSNRTYSTLGGVQPTELNALERCLLGAVQWQTGCSRADWDASVRYLLSAGRCRGLWQYTATPDHPSLFPHTIRVTAKACGRVSRSPSKRGRGNVVARSASRAARVATTA